VSDARSGARDFSAAAAYAQRHGAQAMLVRRDDDTLFSWYAPGFDGATPHAIYSGTKSFWGVTAVAASEDGLLDLDESVGDTFPPWKGGMRSEVTLRHLLSLTSGIGFGGLGNAVPTCAKALEVDVRYAPGTTFTYGGIPLQVFGAVLSAKLAHRKMTPVAYLRERLLDPIGCTVASWRTLKDGTHPLPTGAFVTAEQWSAYGRFIANGGCVGGRRSITADGLRSCVTGSVANPRYGLGWWLSPFPQRFPNLVYASGSGGQALYIEPNERWTIVIFSGGKSFAHAAFLRKLP
jgi:CubicO group peptidase (beta-lactamase class C family)